MHDDTKQIYNYMLNSQYNIAFYEDTYGPEWRITLAEAFISMFMGKA